MSNSHLLTPSVATRLTATAAALLLAGAVHAADVYTPVPLTAGSFNADVVVEKTAPPPLENFVTVTMDGGTNETGNAFFESGYMPNVPAMGLPRHGAVFQAVNDPTHVYQMPPDYTTNNCVFVCPQQRIGGGTLTVAFPTNAYTALSVINASGNANTYWVQCIITHVGGSVETNYFYNTDWWTSGSTANVAWYPFALVSIDGGGFRQMAQPGPGATDNGNLLYADIPLSDTTDPVASVTFNYTNAPSSLPGGRTAIFALSGSTDLPGAAVTNYAPIAVYGFNQDVVVEASALLRGCNFAVSTASMERGTNNWGKIYMEAGFAGQNANYGMPAAGSSITGPDGTHTFTLAPSYTANNALLVAGTNSGPSGGTFVLQTPTTIQTLSLLGGSTWGPRYVDVTVHHQDGTTDATFTGVGIEDWWHSGNRVNGGYTNTLVKITGAGFQTETLGFDINGGANRYELYAIDIPYISQSSPVTRVDIAYSSANADYSSGTPPQTGVAFIMGLAGQAVGGTSYQPLLVTGYNADMVAGKSEVFNPNGIYSTTTVSMDGGTNNTGATWYEQGYYKNMPLTGLPAAGSTLHSIAQANSYTMPVSYSANNAAFIDTNHPTANFTPVAPAHFTALSFLSSDANGWVSNQVVMQYDDNTADTNYFVSQDWFNYNPYAFSSLGRVNLDSGTINNDPGHTTTPNPRLYEAQVGLNNATANLTNVALTYLRGNSTSSRMVVLAMSAATGPYPVIVRGIASSTNAIMEGQSVTLSSWIAGGAQPITYNWQVQSNGVWINLSDGVAGVSGALTLTNTISTYLGWLTNFGSPLNGTFTFRVQAANSVGTVTGPTTSVTVRSGFPDVTMPGDPITCFGAGTADAGPQGNIDDLVGGTPDVKCLWTANANVGFVTTPSGGASIAHAIRLYWANDSDVRDPATVILEGSNDGGTTWSTILPQTGVTHNTTRNNAASVAPNPWTQANQEFQFYGNTTAYTTYRVTFPTVYSTSGNTLTQIGEVEILGQSLNVTPPFFTLNLPPAQTVFVGAAPTLRVAAGGAPVLHYQWYRNNGAIANATNTTFTLANAQMADSGAQFYCQVSNRNGTTNSLVETLNVIAAPTQSYPAAVLADHPMSYYRLDESDNGTGNNGTLANDYVGGLYGTYSNVVLGATGYHPSVDPDPAATFGSFASVDSMIPDIPISFAAPAGQNKAFSVEAWVQASANLTGGLGITTDAGILTVGYGGFEQLNLDCGGSDPAHNFRFYVRDANGGTHGPGGTISPNDYQWHHVVGVCDEANSNVVLYVDGLQNAISSGFSSGLGILGATTPLSIGARRQSTTTDYNYQFLGTIDDVAIYGYALTSTQVLAHFYAAQMPPIFTAQPTNTLLGEGSTLNLYSAAYGAGTVGYQWYQSSDNYNFTSLPGQTSSTLTIPNVTYAAYNNTYFYVVATNAYGAVTSSVPANPPGAWVTVVSGPPQLLADVPLAQLVVAGTTLSISAQFSGSMPITYQWQSSTDGGLTWNNLTDGGRISGAKSTALTVQDVQLSDALSYRLTAQNSYSAGNPSSSGYDAVSVVPTVGFNTNGVGWQVQGTAPSINNGVLVLTDGGGSENASAYYTNKVYVAAPFRASFTYQAQGTQGGMADGACFVIQNDPRGPSVLSGGGGTFGISGVQPSAELEFNLYPSSHGGTGVAFNVNGNNGNIPSPTNPNGYNLSTAPVVLDSGRHINVVLTYWGRGLVNVSLTEQETGASWSTSFDTLSFPGGADLPTLVGADATGGYAWIGFAGADGGAVSYQTVSNFRMESMPELAVSLQPSSVLVSWTPQAFGAFVLQSCTDLHSGVWQNVTAPVSGPYQVTVPRTTGNQFFRLVMP